MHTAGNFLITNADGSGNSSPNNTIYLVSAPNSCVYGKQASQLSANLFSTPNTINNNIPFTGQFLVGSNNFNTAAGIVRVDLYKDEGPNISTSQPNTDDRIEITPTNDSVTGTTTFTPINISLNPIDLFTLGISNPRGYNPATQNGAVRATNWETNSVVATRRILNQFAVQPYVDDTYRADNRWGPKPLYVDPESGNSYSMQTAGQRNGDAIVNIADLTRNDATNEQLTNFGLDGYWERRATRQGIKLIVGQRLELGNTFGWQGAIDPLYPPQLGAAGNTNANMNSRRHELKQFKALRDNLAAVQATAVYHYQGNNGEYPVACMATTAHPSTGQTITNSTTFTNLPNSGNLGVDFLTGNGTNGMEFAPLTRATFEAAMGNANSDLRKALSNLAYFAGDPQGAFPAVQEAAGGVMHPFPTLTMWGNFSNLRRVIQTLNSGTAYANLSLADRTTLQTASCTLGMLAYNLRNYQLEVVNQSLVNLRDLADKLYTLHTGTTTGASPTGLTAAQKNSYTWWRSGTVGTPITATEQQILDRLRNYLQVVADRQYGFLSGSKRIGSTEANSLSNNTFTLCNTIFINRIIGNPTDLNNNQKAGLRQALCQSNAVEQPRYPSLYYLFPLATHGHSGLQDLVVKGEANMMGYGQEALQPREDLNNNGILNVGEDSNVNGVLDHEDYVGNLNIFNLTLMSGINCKPTDAAATACQRNVYRALNDANNNEVDDDPTTSFTNIFISPRTSADWVTPIRAGQSVSPACTIGINPNCRIAQISVNGAVLNPALIDRVIFNGREMMPVRVLDVDLDLLRNTQYAGQDFWLPLPTGTALAATGAVIYSFREDAVREDAIARPSGAAMVAASQTTTTLTDPAVNAVTNISPKPVDFYADPDRRPNGFRLRNGLSLVRTGRANDGRGMAFISDQPVYIQGDFNVHSTNGTTTAANLLQEFTQALLPDWSNFYQRTTLDTRFARPASDTWRPVEILTDAISVLSNGFCDGNILDGLNNANTNSNCPAGGSNNSFRNMNQPSTASTWWREGQGIVETAFNNLPDALKPVAFDRNGLVRVNNATTSYSGNYVAFTANTGKARSWSSTGTAQVNAVLISGLIPSRTQQAYGGLHNFPRFLENWSLLNFQGSFIQLSFSTYGTAPFDQDAWEPGANPTSTTVINYYSPPTRRWGFDTALLLAPPGVVSQRFRQLTPNTNEVYRELSKDDPYVCLLRKQLDNDLSGCT
jgi:hypothetical protein